MPKSACKKMYKERYTLPLPKGNMLLKEHGACTGAVELILKEYALGCNISTLLQRYIEYIRTNKLLRDEKHCDAYLRRSCYNGLRMLITKNRTNEKPRVLRLYRMSGGSGSCALSWYIYGNYITPDAIDSIWSVFLTSIPDSTELYHNHFMLDQIHSELVEYCYLAAGDGVPNNNYINRLNSSFSHDPILKFSQNHIGDGLEPLFYTDIVYLDSFL